MLHLVLTGSLGSEPILVEGDLQLATIDQHVPSKLIKLILCLDKHMEADVVPEHFIQRKQSVPCLSIGVEHELHGPPLQRTIAPLTPVLLWKGID
ncbi:hypothetical protein D3C76_28020 [compost metagenome]